MLPIAPLPVGQKSGRGDSNSQPRNSQTVSTRQFPVISFNRPPPFVVRRPDGIQSQGSLQVNFLASWRNCTSKPLGMVSWIDVRVPGCSIVGVGRGSSFFSDGIEPSILRFRSLMLYTMPDYLAERYGGNAIRLMGASLSLVARDHNLNHIRNDSCP